MPTMLPLRSLSEAEEIEWREPGVGFLPAPAYSYGAGYWAEYRRRDMGYRLTMARAQLVYRSTLSERNPETLLWSGLDVGIGGGAFVEHMQCQGHDINPEALAWLDQIGARWTQTGVDWMAFWDSLEHIFDPSALLSKCRHYCFISTPTYESEDEVADSKHFKPGEHLWYFTAPGLCLFMQKHGFELVEQNSMESDLGREGVGTFVFRRVK